MSTSIISEACLGICLPKSRIDLMEKNHKTFHTRFSIFFNKLKPDNSPTASRQKWIQNRDKQNRDSYKTAQ